MSRENLSEYTDFDSLMVAQASRRLYQPERLDADSALLISRRFAEVYQFYILILNVGL